MAAPVFAEQYATGSPVFGAQFASAFAPAGTLTLGTPTVTSSSISLPWSYDAADHDGIEYRYRLTAGTWPAWVDAGLVTPIEISGLTSGAEYEIEVRAYNSAGVGTPQPVTILVGGGVIPVEFKGMVPDRAISEGSSASFSVAGYFVGSTQPFSYSLVEGMLLPGWSFDPDSATFENGKASEGVMSDLVVQATDTEGNLALSNPFSIEIRKSGSTLHPFNPSVFKPTFLSSIFRETP